MPREDWLIIGISGATCSGKSTIAKEINLLFANSVLVHQDDYFYEVNSDRHTKIPELNHINFEIISSVNMDSMMNRIRNVLQSSSSVQDFEARKDDLEERFLHKVRASKNKPMNYCLLHKIRNLKRIPNILILDGFLLFNDDELLALSDLKFYFTIAKSICWERRKVRTYEPADVPGYFEKYVWPHYLCNYEEVLKKGPDITFIDGGDSIENNLRSVLHKLLSLLS